MEEDDFEPYENFDSFFGRNKHHLKTKKGEDIHINVTISLKESVNGVTKKIQYTRKTYCEECSDRVFQSCFSCGGKGTVFNRMVREKQSCESCDGLGYKNDCSSCNG